MWSRYDVFPSITDSWVSYLKKNPDYKFVVASQQVAYFYPHSIIPTTEFTNDITYISQHFQDKNHNANMLEFIVALGLLKVQQELPQEFPKSMVELEKDIGLKLDIYVENSYQNKFGVEVKNTLGYIGLKYKQGELRRKLDTYTQYNITPVVVAPFLARDLQDHLKDWGFYCNLGYNVTQYIDDAQVDKFYRNSVGDTIFFYKLDGWASAAEAKTWLIEQIRRGNYADMNKEITNAGNDPRIDFIFRKIRGIYKYANLITQV